MVSTEPTDCQVYRGQRGRMKFVLMFRVLAATVLRQNAVTRHFQNGSDSWRITRTLPTSGYDEFLGKGTLTVSEIFFTSQAVAL